MNTPSVQDEKIKNDGSKMKIVCLKKNQIREKML
jgi:hypothetical protein